MNFGRGEVAERLQCMSDLGFKYPDLKIEDELLFEKDGARVHLSNVGNDILLNTISAAVEQFYGRKTTVYPDLY